jgi:hypothetical protein
MITGFSMPSHNRTALHFEAPFMGVRQRFLAAGASFSISAL